MAATTLTAAFQTAKVTLSATPGLCTQVILPVGSAVVSIYADGADLEVASAGTDGVDIGDDFTVVPSGNLLPIRLKRDNDTAAASVYVASATASAVARVMCEPGR